LQWDKALLEYLLEGNHVIERDEDPFAGGMSFRIHRPRPATPPEEEDRDQQEARQDEQEQRQDEHEQRRDDQEHRRDEQEERR
jgi:hypothetical protein